MHRFKIPELFLGCLLTVAIFATGALFAWRPYAAKTRGDIAEQYATKKGDNAKSQDAEIVGPTWLTKDAAGFFAFISALVIGGQAVMFFIQLRYMRRGMNDATIAANAAKDGAKTARDAFTKSERPYLYGFGVNKIDFDPRGTDPVAYIKFSIANYGKTPAKIELPCAGMTDSGDKPETPIMVDMHHSLLTSPIVAPNERRDNVSIHFPTGIGITRIDDDDYPPGDIWIPSLEGQNDFFSG